jgi:hypothetical protein
MHDGICTTQAYQVIQLIARYPDGAIASKQVEGDGGSLTSGLERILVWLCKSLPDKPSCCSDNHRWGIVVPTSLGQVSATCGHCDHQLPQASDPIKDLPEAGSSSGLEVGQPNVVQNLGGGILLSS